MAEFAVIGMGRFGRAVARNLAEQGQAVLAIDRDADRLDRVAALVDSTARVDATDENALGNLDLDRMACVVVAMGSRATEASILTTALLRELGVPRIVARAFDEPHSRVLLAIGASEVLNPEEEIGRRLARRLSTPSVVGEIALGDARVAEVEAPEAMVGKSLLELDLRNRLDLSVLAIRRGLATLTNPSAEEPVESGDVLVVLGHPAAIDRLASLK
jgi:trk system potassium uptake protein TrkA